MQNFLAVALLLVLISLVFWPEDVFKTQGQNSPLQSTIRELERATGKKGVNLSGAGFVHHYLGIQETKDNE